MKSAILLPIIVVLVVIAAVGLIKLTGVNPFQKPLEGGVVETAITKLLDTKTFKINGKIEVEIKVSPDDMDGEGVVAALPDISSVKIFVDISASVDQRKKDNLKTFSSIDLGVDAGGMQLAGVLEAITVDGGFYVRLVSIPSMLSAFLGNIESIKNQWIKIDLGPLKDQYQATVNQAGVELDQEQIDEQLKVLFEEMKELLKGKTLFDVTKEFGVEEVNEISTEHYFVTANKEAIKGFIIEYIELTKEYVPAEQKAEYEKSIEEAMQGFPEKFEEFWAAIGGMGFDIWVEKRTGRLVRILEQKDIDTFGVGDMPKEIEGIDIKVDFSFSDFNKRVDIKEPSEAKPLAEILSGVMSMFAPQGFDVPALPDGF